MEFDNSFPSLVGRSKVPGFPRRLHFAEAMSSQALHSCCASQSALPDCLRKQPICLNKERNYTRSSNFSGSYFLLTADESLGISSYFYLCPTSTQHTVFYCFKLLKGQKTKQFQFLVQKTRSFCSLQTPFFTAPQ